MPGHDVVIETIPAGAVRRQPEAQLSAMVPASVQQAKSEGTTVCLLLLRVLKDAGLADIGETEILDRRVTPIFRSALR